MNKLWIFGDSFSAKWHMKWFWVNEYVKYKGYKPKHFYDIVSDELNLSVENKAIGGCDNYTIFQEICDNVDKINPEDVVIIGWTDVVRFRFANPDYDVWYPNKWISLIPNSTKQNFINRYITKSTAEEIIVNRDNEQYVEEVKSWMKIIKKSLPNNKILFWTWCGDNWKYFKPVSIENETNGIVADAHFGEIGNQNLAKWMIEMIQQEELHIDRYLKNVL